MVKDSKVKQRISLMVFIVIVLLSGWCGVWVDSMLPEQPEGNSLGMLVWLVLPLLAAILIRAYNRDWKDMGIKPNIRGNLKWYVVSFAIYPFITIVTLGLAFLFGGIELSTIEMSAFITLVVVSVGGNFIKNIFEEFAWRGHLTPKLLELKVNDWFIYLISGLVWALWHAVYYLVFLPEEYLGSLSRVGILLVGCVLMVCWAMMYVEIYRLTKSVWPCVLMHAIEDAFPTVLVTTSGMLTFVNHYVDFWLNPITGVLATVLFLGVGLLLRSIRLQKD